MKFADIKVGAILVLQDRYPCKLVEVNWSHPGKHGGSKKAVVGMDIITDKKYTEIFTNSSIIQEPVIRRQKYRVIWIDEDGYLHLQDSGGNVREDITTSSCDPDLLGEIEKYDDKKVDITLTTVFVNEEIYGYKIGL